MVGKCFIRGKPQGNRQVLGLGFLVHKHIEKNIVEFHNVRERVASVTVKLNIRYNVNTIQVYLSACSHSDEEIKSLYGVHLASDNEKTFHKNNGFSWQ